MSNPHNPNQQIQNYLPQDIEHVVETTYVITNQVESSGQPVMRSLNEVDQLKMIIRQMEQERNHIVESEVLKALKAQEEQFNIFYQDNIKKVEQHYENEVIPQKIKTVENEFYKHQPLSTLTQATSSSSTLISTDTPRALKDFKQEAYLSEKYEQWKATYLPVILQVKEKEWRERYETVEFEKILSLKYEEWENIKLFSIIKEEKNKWILEQLFAQKLAQLNRQYELTLNAKIHEVDLYWQQTFDQRISAQLVQLNVNQQSLVKAKIHEVEQYWEEVVMPQRFRQWQQEHGSSSISSESLPKSATVSYTRADLERILAQQYLKWQSQTQKQFCTRLQAEQRNWQLTLLPRVKQQLQIQYAATHQLTSQLDTSKIDKIIKAKHEQWIKTQLPQYSRVEKIKWLEEYMKNELEIMINKEQKEQITSKLLAIVKQPRNYWVVEAIMKELRPQVQGSINSQQRSIWKQDHQKTLNIQIQQVQKHWSDILQHQRNNFQKTLQSALQAKTAQIQTYWQQVMLPQIKTQWQTQQIQQLKSQTVDESSQDEITRRNNALMQVQIQNRIEKLMRTELPLIIQKNRQEWQLNFTQTQEFSAFLLHQRQEWVKAVETDYHNQLNQQKIYFEAQIQNIRTQAALSLNELKQTLFLRQSQYRTLEAKLFTTEIALIQNNKPKQSLITQEVIEKLKIDHQNLVHQLKLSYEQKLSQVNHEKSLLMIQIKQLQISLQNAQPSTRPKQSINLSVIQANFDKQVLSLEATIKTKESQNNFLKKSLNGLTLENQQLNSRIINLNGKFSNFQTLLDEARSNSIKLDYQIKFLKEKEASFFKKLQNKDLEFNQVKSRLEFEKSLLQKKLRQHSSSSQALSALQLKINEYESQLSLKHSSLKTLENEIQRKKRQLEQEKQRSASYLRQIEVQKSSIKQYESVVQDMRLQIRKSCDQINRQKLIIQSGQHKQKSFIQQIKKLQSRAKTSTQSQQLIRQNERIKFQLSKLRQRLIQIQSKQSMQIYKLKQTIFSLSNKLNSTTVGFREGDITEIEILKRINHEISDLVTSNKQLQMRIIVLENQKELSAFGISIQRFFVAFQEQMDHLINYFVSAEMWSLESISVYNKFQHKSRETLTHGYVEDYFRQWQTLMRGLIEQNHQRNTNLAKITSKGQGSPIKDDEIDQIVDKYDAVLNDVKFTLSEFIKTGDGEYIHLMSKSLGLDVEETLFLKENGVLKK